MHYNWHRFYDPSTGRYVSADPIRLAGGMNLYAYVRDNPVNAVDPEGLKSLRDRFNDFKDAKDVLEKCKSLFNDKGEFNCKCGDLISCNDCMKTICEHYGPVGSPAFGGCFAPLQKVCFDCGM